MRTLFASGCALRAYKPNLISKITAFLMDAGIIDGSYEICCKMPQTIDEDLVVIVCCPGCRHIFESLPNVHAVSLWKVLLDSAFPLPDYNGKKMTIHDACIARDRDSSEMQDSVRKLCRRMNIELHRVMLYEPLGSIAARFFVAISGGPVSRSSHWSSKKS